MSSARAEILSRVRAVARIEPPPLERTYRLRGRLGADERVALFTERVAGYRAEVRNVREVAADVESACRSRGAIRVGVPPDLPALWRPPLEVVEDDALSPRELDRLDAVVTGCTLGIAETGTVVLSGGPAEGRRALTLVPDLHICVVRRDQIVETVPDAFGLLAERARRPLTFISGPSATSDIELSRVEGVHGPRSLVVLIVTEGDR